MSRLGIAFFLPAPAGGTNEHLRRQKKLEINVMLSDDV
jgi:hypothetical protein